jgi:hypothetical protein
MNWLILEIVNTIFNNLIIKEIISCSQVSKLFYLVCDYQYDRLLNGCNKDIYGKQIFKNINAKEKYITCYELEKISSFNYCITEQLFRTDIILIENKKIKQIPGALKYLKTVRSLKICNTFVEEVPVSMCSLNNLTKLKNML